MSDFTQRFLFDDADVRGELVTLNDSYTQVLANHTYPQPVAQLLGELLAAAALLVGTLKFDGLLVLQARSSGPLPLLMVECSSSGDLRGIARYQAEAIPAVAGLPELMPDGVLSLTVEPKEGARYQGIVALDGPDLSSCFSSYFAMSEQLPTRFWLNADGQCARGFLLQQLPAERITDAEERAANWQHLTVLADTLSAAEQLTLDNQTLLHRLYHQETLELFEPRVLQFGCSCSRDRSANALVSLGQADAEQLLREHQGLAHIDCQFCNQRYAFDATDIAQLFAGAGTQSPSATRH
ncbi:MAG: Hsp33 family molecular chaperone HslO [Pseudomonas sp.]